MPSEPILLNLIIDTIYIFALTYISVNDIKNKIITNRSNVILSLLGVINICLKNIEHINIIFIKLIITLIVSVILIFIRLILKRQIGGGDIKMMFVFGLILDPLLGALAIFIGSLIALPISLILLQKQKERVIPFGPFLLLALTFIYYTQITTPMVLSWLRFN
jgi:Flp pilus assembly protein protease CpaA